MNTDSFLGLSEFVEQSLGELGTVLIDETTGNIVRRCSGESLYNICVMFRRINEEFSDESLSDQIIAAIGDRTTGYRGSFGDCWGVTSHDTAGTIVYNIGYQLCAKVWDAIGHPVNGTWPHWNELSTECQKNVSEIELNNCRPVVGRSEIVAALRTERIMFLNKIQTDGRVLSNRTVGKPVWSAAFSRATWLIQFKKSGRFSQGEKRFREHIDVLLASGHARLRDSNKAQGPIEFDLEYLANEGIELPAI